MGLVRVLRRVNELRLIVWFQEVHVGWVQRPLLNLDFASALVMALCVELDGRAVLATSERVSRLWPALVPTLSPTLREFSLRIVGSDDLVVVDLVVLDLV